MKQPYTETEKLLMEKLAEAVTLFNSLTSTHPCHNRDFADGIHKAQDVMIHRIVQRDYPDTFPTHKTK